MAVVLFPVSSEVPALRPETIDALYASGARVWRTDLDGALTVTFDGPTPTVESAR